MWTGAVGCGEQTIPETASASILNGEKLKQRLQQKSPAVKIIICW